MFVTLYISVLFLASLCTNTANGQLSTLRFVNLVFRHGERNPARIYPNNPLRTDVWPQKTLGWLTPKGEQTTHELGEYIRRRYDGFLNESYYHDELKIWSSDVYRTVMSAHSFLDGLYNTSTGPIIPVMTVGRTSNDAMLLLSKYCPRREQLREYLFTDSEIANKTNTEYAPLFRFLENVTGEDHLAVGYDIYYVVDCLECQIAYGLPVPEWYNTSMRETLLKINDINFEYYGKGDVLKRITGGPLLERLTQTFKSKQIPGIYEEKFHIYSAHDTTLSSLMTSMDIFDGKRPPVASAVLMELHEISPNNYSVQVLYKNGSSEEAHPITDRVKGCSSEMCPFETFLEGVKSGIPDNWEKECGIPEPTEQPECSTQKSDPSRGVSNVFSVWMDILAVVLVLIMWT